MTVVLKAETGPPGTATFAVQVDGKRVGRFIASDHLLYCPNGLVDVVVFLRVLRAAAEVQELKPFIKL